MYEPQASSRAHATYTVRLEIENHPALIDIFGLYFSEAVKNDVISRVQALGVYPGVTAHSEGIFVIRCSPPSLERVVSKRKRRDFLEIIQSYIESEPVESPAGRAYLKLHVTECPPNNDLAAADTINLKNTLKHSRSPQMDVRASTAILDELRNGKLVLAFQPITLLTPSSSNITLYQEALLRRCVPETQRLCAWPNAIEALERTGLISRLDFSVIWTIVLLLKRHPDQYLGCNISASTLRNASYWEFIINHLKTHVNTAQRLTLEVTETGVFSDMSEALAIISRLRACGVSIAVDDFGSGNITLQHLARIRPDVVKIDRSILLWSRDPHYSPDLLKHLTTVCHDYTPCVVIEGVEHIEDMDAARYAGAQCVQGFLIQHPETAPNWLHPSRAVVIDIASNAQTQRTPEL